MTHNNNENNMSLIKPIQTVMTKRERELERILLQRNLTTQRSIDAAKLESSITNESIGTILVKNGFLRQLDLVNALLCIDPESLIDEELILAHVPLNLLIENRIMIAAETVNAVYVACLCETARAKVLLSPLFPKQELIFIPASADRIRGYVEKLRIIHDSDASILEMLIREAILQQASDIHIIPRRNSFSVLMRFLGVRTLVYENELEEYLTLCAKIKDRSRMDLAERRIPQDGSFSIEYNGRIIDLRVATIPTLYGEVIVIRILDPERAQFNLQSLGISGVDQWLQASSRSDGLCLICGPTGSGKTTTLNATTRQLDRFEKSIYTIEDPVEYNIPFVAQVNINEAVGLTFPRAVRAFMRGDPDVIVVGEVRDYETARHAVKAAETGHLVYATLHTGSIHGSVQRLKDLNVDPHELKYILRSVMAQRLMRTLCPVCNGVEPDSHNCPQCRGRRYTSRTIVSECHYFPTMDDVNELLNSDTIRWQTMLEDAYSKYYAGMTDENELVRVFGAEANKIIEQRGRRA
jgi:general secretion pathway protein E